MNAIKIPLNRVCLLFLFCLPLSLHAQSNECSQYAAWLPTSTREGPVTDEERTQAQKDAGRLRARMKAEVQPHVMLLTHIADVVRPHLPTYALLGDYYYFVFYNEEIGHDALTLPRGHILIAREVIEKVIPFEALVYPQVHEMGHVALDTINTERALLSELSTEIEILSERILLVTDEEERKRIASRGRAILSLLDGGVHKQLELEADIFAATVMYSAGFDTHAVADYMEQSIAEFGDTMDGHPSRSQIAQLFRCFPQDRIVDHADLREEFRKLQERMKQL